MSEAIFLDASFWISMRDPRDPQFQLTRAILGKLSGSRPILITTLLVAAETHAYYSRSRAVRPHILEDMENRGVFRFETVTPDDQTFAFEILRKHEDKSYSLCDALSFALMKRLRVARALSLDDHFSQIGLFQIIDHPDRV